MTAGTLERERTTFSGAGITLPRVVRAEWTKLWSLRSTYWTLLATFAITVGFGVLISWGETSSLDDMSAAQRAGIDATGNTMAGLMFGQLAIAVLGALVVSGEYSTGGIRSSLVAVPQRIRLLLAKAIVFVAVGTVVGIGTTFAAWFAGMPFFRAHDLGQSLGDPGVLRAVVGGGLLVPACGMFGLALAAILRHTAGVITAAVALLFVAPPLIGLIPGSFGDTLGKYFTTNAGQHVTDVLQSPGQLAPWAGYAVFTAEWLLLAVLGGWLLRRRDA